MANVTFAWYLCNRTLPSFGCELSQVLPFYRRDSKNECAPACSILLSENGFRRAFH